MFTRWTNGWTSIHLLPCVSPVSVRCPGFPGSPLAAPLVPTPVVRCKLPVWPSTRFAWPSPCSLSLGWGFGSQRVLLGKCSRSDLPRGWSTSLLKCDVLDGAILSQARRRKELTYPELTGEHGRARLVVLACEVGGRWSDETFRFIAGLARANKARSEPRAIRAATSMAQEMEHFVGLLWSSRFWSVPSGETARFGC